MEASYCHPMTGPPDPNCPVVGVLPAAEYPHDTPYPGAPPLKEGNGCSVEGLGVANYGGMRSVYLAGDWCTGRLFGVGWDGSKWQLEELLHTNLQFTAGGNGEDGYVYAVNCNCFYTADRGPTSNPPGALWKIVPASEVKPGQETALTVQQITQSLPATGTPQFRNALNNAAITLNKYPNETVTTKVLDFQRTGTNPYKGDRDAVAAGSALYNQWCASCHMPDATGRMGPNLVDAQFNHPRVATDVGTFEVIYGGGTGAMQAFGDRLTQEEILKIMAFIDSLKRR
jgi:cytochrome c(L)